ncbi:TRAP transporter substrate-binding protein [Priestia abyssalis]|uniref:TRAP transporter substrate-binding protein n=1 Tax=Priestia abyssalis TaxID=1221450 RepID=UPI00099499AF|nr:DctP family TRAP transporter solute-binding subunit [Priestia abyssalis]
MKKWLLVLVTCMLMLATACGKRDAASNGGSKEEGDTYTMRIAYLPPEQQSTHIAAEKFKETVEKNSNGRIEVQLYPNATLFASDREAIEAVQLGNVEATIPAAPAVVGFNKKFMVFDLPFLFDTRENAFKAMDGELGQGLMKDLESNGFKGLTFAENGYRHVSNNRGPITKPEDMKGLKMRTLENPLHTETFNAFGANASPFAFGELYTALQQNTFDAMDCPISIYETNKFYEVQKYLTLTGHVYSATILLANLDFYNSLPEDLQKVLDEASVQFRDDQRKLSAEQDAEFLEGLKEKGMQINELTPEQKAKFREAAQPIYDKFVPEIGEDLVEQAKKANE